MNSRRRASARRTGRAARSAAAATLALAAQAYAGQLFSFETGYYDATLNPTGEIDPVHLSSGAAPPTSYVWGHSFDASLVDHSWSTVGATDGGYSMEIRDPNGGFSWGTQVLFNDPVGPPGDPRFNDLAGSTKLLVDIATPAGGPDYEVGFPAINYNGGFITSYNPGEGGNYNQFTSGPASQTALTYRTFTWDFGGQMLANAGSIWNGLPSANSTAPYRYTMIHFNTNSGNGTTPSYFYFDNVRVVNENPDLPTWTAPGGSGNWTTAADWNAGGVPNAVDAHAIFYGGGNGSVTLNSAVTIGTLVLDAQMTTYQYNGAGTTPPPIVNYNVAGSGSLIFDVSAGNGSISVVAGNHTVGVPVTMNDNLTIDTSAGFSTDTGAPLGGRLSAVPVTSITFGSPVTLASGVTLSSNGAGLVTYAGGISGSTGNLNVRGGSSTLGATSTVANLGISPSALLTVGASGGNRVLRTTSVNITGRLNLTDNKLITQTAAGTWNGSAYTGVTGLIVSGKGTSNTWNGASGILTTQTHAVGSNFTSIGVSTGAEVLVSRGLSATQTMVWAGQTIAAADNLVMYTYGGDANLDGKLNIDDYVAIDQGIQSSLTGWSNGDFNYDGKVNIDDYTTVIDSNVGNQILGTFPAAGGFGDGVAAVPEPASLGLAGVMAAAAYLRRRPRKQRPG